MHSQESIDGALLVDKPSGMTSHDVVHAVRKHYGIKKVGHCGTLDPNATGLLILVLGRATKLADRFSGEDKVYEGVMRLGEATDSYDIDGQVTETREVPPLTVEIINQKASTFTGDIMQKPPMVSAVKKDGVPLYKLARKGIEVERPDRLIHVYYFRFLDYEAPDARFEIASTKGTYVRSLVHDLGQTLGSGAHLTALRRTASGKFNICDAQTLDAILGDGIVALKQRRLPIHQLQRESPPNTP